MRGKGNTRKWRRKVFVQRWWSLFQVVMLLSLLSFGHARRVVQCMTYVYSSIRMLTPLKARSGQSFTASYVCKYLLLYYHYIIITLILGKQGLQKRMLFCRKGLSPTGAYHTVSYQSLQTSLKFTYRFHYQEYFWAARRKALNWKLNHLWTQNQIIGMYLQNSIFCSGCSVQNSLGCRQR